MNLSSLDNGKIIHATVACTHCCSQAYGGVVVNMGRRWENWEDENKD